MTILLNYHVTGTIGTSFSGDGVFSNLAGAAPTVVDAADFEKGFSFPSTGQSLVATNITSTTGRVVVDVVASFAAAPTVATDLISLRGSATIAKIVVNASGQLVLQNSAGANTGLGAVPVGKKFRLRLDSNGTALSATVYNNDDDTSVASSGTQTNAAANAITSLRLGFSVASNAGVVISWPVISTNPADSGPRAYAAAQPPTANAGGARVVAVGNSLQLQGTGAVGGGTGTLAYQWQLATTEGGAAATLTNENTATPTVAASAGGVIKYTLTVSDTSSGLSATDQATVYIPVAIARPLSVTANPGAWSTSGAANAAAALADGDVATFTQSPDNPSAPATIRIRLAPLLAGTGFTLTLDHQLIGTGNGTATVSVYEGDSLRKSWTIAPSAASQTTALTMTSSELATLGSLNALDVELAWQV